MFSFSNHTDDYNRKLGLDDASKRARSDNYDPNTPSSSTATTSTRRRKGFAYKYSIDEDYDIKNRYDTYDAYEERKIRTTLNGNNDSTTSTIETTSSSSISSSEQKNDVIDDDIIDVEATVQNDSSNMKKNEKTRQEQSTKKQQQQQQSWEDRAQAYEKVPPKNIKAWGPEGIIDGGMDIRTFAAQCALDEISKARRVFEKKEENVNIAETELIQLKR